MVPLIPLKQEFTIVLPTLSKMSFVECLKSNTLSYSWYCYCGFPLDKYSVTVVFEEDFNAS